MTPSERTARHDEIERIRQEACDEGPFVRAFFVDDMQVMTPQAMMEIYADPDVTILSHQTDYGSAPPDDVRNADARRQERKRARNRDLRHFAMLGSDTDVSVVIASCHPFLFERWISLVNLRPDEFSIRVPPITKERQEIANQVFYRKIEYFTEVTEGTTGVASAMRGQPRTGTTPGATVSDRILKMLMDENPRQREADLRELADIRRSKKKIDEQQRIIDDLRRRLDVLNAEHDRIVVTVQRSPSETRGDTTEQGESPTKVATPEQHAPAEQGTKPTKAELREQFVQTVITGASYDTFDVLEMRPPPDSVPTAPVVTPYRAPRVTILRPSSLDPTPVRPPPIARAPTAPPPIRPSANIIRPLLPLDQLGPSPASSSEESESETKTAPMSAAATSVEPVTTSAKAEPPASSSKVPEAMPGTSSGKGAVKRVVVLPHELDEREQEEYEEYLDELDEKARRTGRVQTPENQPYQGPRSRSKSKAAKRIREDERGPDVPTVILKTKEMEQEEQNAVLTLNAPLVEQHFVNFYDPPVMDAVMADPKRPKFCPDAHDGNVMFSLPEASNKVPSQCTYQTCTMRNPGLFYEEHSEGKAKYMMISTQEALSRSLMNSGPYAMTTRISRKSTYNYGYAGCDVWDEVRAKLDKIRFFDKIYESGVYSFDIEGWPDRDAREKGLSTVELQRAMSVVTVSNIDGVMLQWGVRYDGRSPPKSSAPPEITALLADPSLFRIAFGSFGDTQRLIASGLFKQVNAGCEMGNLIMLMFPQEERELRQIRTGKRYAAAKLEAKLHFVDKLTGDPNEVLFKVWQKPWNLDISKWGKDREDMITYNHYDHRAAWATLFAFCRRVNDLARRRGDVIRVAHYILAKIAGHDNRTTTGPWTQDFLRPFPAWMERNEYPVSGGHAPVRPWPLYLKDGFFNSPEVVAKILRNLARDYQIDRNSITAEDVDHVEITMGKAFRFLSANDFMAKSLRKAEAAPTYPHICYRCSSHGHEGHECPAKNLECFYCKGKDHVLNVCPVLHGVCGVCDFRGHCPEDHETSDMVGLLARFHVMRILGFYTVRLASKRWAVGYKGEGPAGSCEWLDRKTAKDRLRTRIEAMEDEAMQE